METFGRFIFVVVTLSATLKIIVNGTIELFDEGQLNNLLVYVSDNVPERNGDTLRALKFVITEASKSLHKATKRIKNGQFALNFGEVHIRVPKTWRVQAEPVTWQQCVKSEFKITTKGMNGNTDKPYTKQIGGCGDPADFSRFTDTFLGSSSDLKIKGKIMMREFVKLRYGVFSEEPLKNVLYVFDKDKFIQSSCPDTIKWNVNHDEMVCSDKNKVCSYTILPHQEHRYSVMFDAESMTSEYFCNNDSRPHNSKAKSLQNTKCQGQSITSVLMKHADFKNGRNTTGNVDPSFRIVKAMPRKIVLVLDASGSMGPYINTTRKALKHFIEYSIEDGAELGIVTFNFFATILSALVEINENNKKELLLKIDSLMVFGATNIGDGLLKACEVLGSNIGSPDKVYGTIILLSDGEHNENTTIDYPPAIDNIIQKGIVTNTISYGDISDSNLNRLSKKTGGMFLYASTTSSQSELFNKFTIQRPCDISEDRTRKVNEGQIKVTSEHSIVDFTYIDQFIGKDTVIDLDIRSNVSNYAIKLISPAGIKYDGSKKSVIKNRTTVTFKLVGKPEAGMYKLEMIPRVKRRYKRSTFSANIRFQIASSQKEVYSSEGSVSTTLIDVVNETSSVTITIDLSNIEREKFDKIDVKMTMKYPDKSSLSWRMTDEGWGDDSIYDDGVYTRTIYARSFTQKGFYEFQGHVTMIDSTNQVTIKRSVDMESLRVLHVGNAPILDKVAPAEIDRVSVVSTNVANKTITLEFTAPGDDSLTGNINQYDVRIKAAKKTYTRRVIENASPFDRIRLQLKLTEVDIVEHFALSIRGLDPFENAGVWSEWTFVQWDL